MYFSLPSMLEIEPAMLSCGDTHSYAGTCEVREMTKSSPTALRLQTAADDASTEGPTSGAPAHAATDVPLEVQEESRGSVVQTTSYA